MLTLSSMTGLFFGSPSTVLAPLCCCLSGLNGIRRTRPRRCGSGAGTRTWGGDPDLGPALVAGLSGSNRLLVADYEGHRMAHPAAETLTPDHLTEDLLAIADAGGADAFGYYG